MYVKTRLLLIFLMVVLAASGVIAQDDDDATFIPPAGLGAPHPDRPVGLTVSTDAVAPGYILVSSVQSKQSILLDNAGQVVHLWDSDYYSANSLYLTPEGHLLRPASLDEPENTFGFNGKWGFTGGRIELFDWDSQLLWAFDYYADDYITHHDVELMPNGHILLIAFERLTADQAIALGRNPDLLPEAGEVWPERIVEVDPETEEIVWEWRVQDHLVQDFDPELPNYGVVADNPGKIDLNAGSVTQVNWLHINAIDYNAELDQIILSPRTFSEIWVIDHSVSTEEARGEAGDLLYRWGNPQMYKSGTAEDRHLYYQHDAQWIPADYPGGGNVLVYNNGGDDERPYSTIVEIALPLNDEGHYLMEAGTPTLPNNYVWEYRADPPERFYSALMSGMQRLPNGNTFISEGLNGRIFEVSPAGEIVWEYYMPPAVWVFRAERYAPEMFAGRDLSQTLTFEGGEIWGAECVDGSRQRLHAYLQQESDSMELFVNTYGDSAQEQWEDEACAEHDGVAVRLRG